MARPAASGAAIGRATKEQEASGGERPSHRTSIELAILLRVRFESKVGMNDLAQPCQLCRTRHNWHNADYRIMPAETLMIWFYGPYLGPLGSPLAEPTRHNSDIDHPVIALRLKEEGLPVAGGQGTWRCERPPPKTPRQRDTRIRCWCHGDPGRTNLAERPEDLPSSRVASWAEGVIATMFLTKLKAAMALVFILGLIDTGAGVFAGNLGRPPTTRVGRPEPCAHESHRGGVRSQASRRPHR